MGFNLDGSFTTRRPKISDGFRAVEPHVMRLKNGSPSSYWLNDVHHPKLNGLLLA